ncbi:MAG: anti-sigma factor antagonist [Frankiales bacterium]|jgi:anti-anti-sigma factor|nr:anti-sigma factor antagonist [Frankiales bacterium]
MTAVSHEPTDAGPVRIVRLTDECEIGMLPWLRAQLERAVAQGPGLLVVDLTDCALLDAQAVPVLVEAARELAAGDGRLLLRGGSPQVARLVALADPDGELCLSPA